MVEQIPVRYQVVRLWESEVRSDVEQCMAKILSAGGKSLRAVPGKTFAEFFAGIGLMRCAFGASSRKSSTPTRARCSCRAAVR